MLESNLVVAKSRNAKALHQTSVTKTLESFMATGADLSPTEAQWMDITAELPDLIFANLITCHNLSARIKQLRAQSLHLIGRALRLISDLRLQQRTLELNEPVGQMPPISVPISKWSPLIMEVIRAQQVMQETDAKAGMILYGFFA